MRWLYTLLWCILAPIFSVVHPCRLVGRENLPEKGGLFCANHAKWHDPIYLIAAIGPRPQLHPMAKAELLHVPVLGWLLKKVGVFAVDRGKSDVGAIKTAMKYLKGGESVLIFPEGTRIKDGMDKNGQESEGKAGAAMLAVRTGAALIPVYIPPKKRWFRVTHIMVGAPYHPQVESRKGSSEEYQAIAADLMERIYGMEEQPK